MMIKYCGPFSAVLQSKQAMNSKTEKCSKCGAENVPLSVITDDSNIAISTQRIALCPACMGIS